MYQQTKQKHTIMTTLNTYKVAETSSSYYQLEERYCAKLKHTIWVLTTIVKGIEITRDVYQRLSKETRSFFGA